jgi:hypothetical protein
MEDNLLRGWEACLNAADLDGIISLYADDAVLWGTFSDVIRNTPALIREYYQVLYRKKNLKVKFGSSTSRSFGKAVLYSGEYEFTYEDNELIICPARFSFVFYKDNDSVYKIVDHHSSLTPKSISTNEISS